MSSPRRLTHAGPSNTTDKAQPSSSTLTLELDDPTRSRYPRPSLSRTASPTDSFAVARPSSPLDLDERPPIPRATPATLPNGDDDPMQLTQTRRRSTLTPANAALGARPTPYPRRRSSNLSTSSSRRGSLPTLHLRATSVSTLPATPLHLPDHQAVPMQEDLYSNLQSFTFGETSQPGPGPSASLASHPGDFISPFTRPQAPSAPLEWTPRASISTVRSREGQDDDEEARIGARGKMRAIDDGGRRPSLPTNRRRSISPSDEHASQLHPHESDGTRSRAQDLDNFATIDSDVETDLEPDLALSGDASSIRSFNTFGSGGRREWSTTDHPRHLHPIGELVQDRRGSLPISMRRTSTGSVRDHPLAHIPNTIAQSRRGSRSVDDDIHIISHFSALADPSTSQQHQTQENVEMPPAGDVYQGFNLDFIYDSSDGAAVAGSSSGPTAPATQDLGLSWLTWGTAGISGPDRRPSTATVATVDDAFMKHIKRMDPEYQQRRTEWSFKREHMGKNGVVVSTDDYSSPKPGSPEPPTRTGQGRHGWSMEQQDELWRCQWLGRIRISKRIGSQSADSSKPPQQHLHVRHMVDPFNRGNTLGGPDALVHKHSRAQAFSIYRMHGLFSSHKRQDMLAQTRPSGEGYGPSHSQSGSAQVRLHTEQSILLATKSIQEHFTSTKTVGKLSTHGLLKDTRDDPPRRREDSPSSTPRMNAATSSSADAPTSASSTQLSGRTRGATITSTSPLYGEHTYPPRPITQSAGLAARPRTAQPSVRERELPPIPSGNLSDSDRHLSSSSGGSSPSGSRRTDDDDSDQDVDYTLGPVGRSSHAEAFAMLDPSRLEYMRNRTDRDVTSAHQAHFAEVDYPSRSGLARILPRRLLGGGPKSGSKSPPSTAPASAVMEGHFNPPWVTLNTRKKQEDQERAIKVLNDSFFEVGLLPSFRPATRESSTRRRQLTGAAIFEPIADDSLYMLLPLWPGETDPAHAVETDRFANGIPVDQCQYLLVWYSAFQTDEKGKGKDGKQKRAPPHRGSSKQVSLASYRVVARLVSYGDLSGSGVRLPPTGLSVTGPIYDAMSHLPERRLSDIDDELGVVIAICHGRESGVELLPEGLEKLGLTVRQDYSDPDVPAPLSPIGRAAVELAWIGCMAVMGYGPAHTTLPML